MKKPTHNSIRLWAVLLWLALWQAASMRLNLPVLLPSEPEPELLPELLLPEPVLLPELLLVLLLLLQVRL